MRPCVLGLFIATLGLLSGGPLAWSGQADVVAAKAYPEGEGKWRIEVTVRHGDTGWDHYADKWDVLAPDGSVLGTRTLLHPHENEQPFTRSLGGVPVPDGVSNLRIRAHDSVHGYGGAEVEITLTR